MTPKVIIAKSGYSAFTETNPDNLIFSSDYNTLKYATNGSTNISIPVNANPFETEFVVVNHNFGYKPFFTAFFPRNFGSTQFVNLPYGFADAGIYFYLFIYVTDTQLILLVSSTGTGADINFTVYYKLFKNDLGL